MDRRSRLIIDACLNAPGAILHIGCGDPGCSMDSQEWLHRHIYRASRFHVVGVDVNRDRVAEMLRAGYDVIHSSAYTVMSLFLEGRKFSLIIMGEVIEHLGSPSEALSVARTLLADDGKIILTTPNPFAATHALWFWLSGGREHHGDEHVLWESPRTMRSLCRSVGLKVEKVYFCAYGFQRRKWWAHGLALLELIPWLRQTVEYEIVRD